MSVPKAAGAILVIAAALAILAPTATAASISEPTVTGTQGANGWYTSNVTVTFTITGTSFTSINCGVWQLTGQGAVGVVTLTNDGGQQAASCSVNAPDGSDSKTRLFNIDKTPPSVTNAAPDRGPNGNGWYRAPVTVTFSGTDATSGIASCTQPVYSGPDDGNASVGGTCTDKAGNTASGSFALKYDATAPTVSPSPARGPDANGWYNHSVAVAFAGSDGASGVDTCTSAEYTGPDAENASLSGSCSDKAGNSASASFSLKYDGTPPTVTAAPMRPPDANGWYNRPISLTVNGTDATSKVDSCSGGSYTGPDKADGTIVAVCRDLAGNEASQPVALKFDSTPPKLGKVTVALGSRSATLRWTASPDTASVMVLRRAGKAKKLATVYRGDGKTFVDKKLKDGVRYRYTITGRDAAGNVATAAAVATPRALWQPLPGQKLRGAPVLAWAPVAKADYYNVQIFVKGRKVLSEWPRRTKLKLDRKWTFDGHRYTLAKGRYRWYVWPGFGQRSASKYGKLLGGSFFVVT